jgi:spore maturation protein CgeB
MVMAGYSPSVRLFEAAACAATILSDNWSGLDEFFSSGSEILLASSYADSLLYLRDFSETELKQIGQAARSRIISEHSSVRRAQQFEDLVSSATHGTSQVSASAR